MESITRIFLLIILPAAFTFRGLERRVNAQSPIVVQAKTIYGDVYDCVDIYKQPALNHPALKDPKVKDSVYAYIKNTVAENQRRKTDDEDSIKKLFFWEDEGCPIGTVPFVDEVESTHLKSASKSLLNHSLARANPTEFAGVVLDKRTGFSVGITNASAEIALYNPQVADGSSQQYTAASIILESGNDNQLQVGWMVSPYLFGDQKTRLYAAMRVSNDANDICYNTQCQDFIQLSHFLPLGYVFANISSIGVDRFVTHYGVIQNKGGWEVYMAESPILIGQFPDYLFTNMKQSAERVRFGGQIYAPLSDETTPPMGSGEFKIGNFGRTAYMRNVLVNNIFPNDSLVSRSRCYDASPIVSGSDQIYDSNFMFGGPGGKDGVTCV